MATEVKLPRLGQGMESGTIVRWLKNEGDQVERGEPLYELDTEKVTQEVEAEASGVLLKIAVREGEVDVGRTIAFIGEAGEAVSDRPAPETASDDGGVRTSAERPAEAPAREPERGTEVGAAEAFREARSRSLDASEARVKASPLARRIARERGVDIAALHGTGPEGRVVAEDVDRAVAAPAPTEGAVAAIPAGEVEEIPLTSMRKTIARRLTEAWEAPVFQLVVSADMTRTLAVRAQLVDLTEEGGTKPTISDLLTKVAAAALLRHRPLNAHFAGDAVRIYPTANVGIAVAVPGGLVVPVIRGADRKTIAEIAADRAALVDRARSGKLKQEDLADGTFSISNLGMYGVEQFIAVLNPPQVAILAVGATEDRAVVEDGAVVVKPMMTMALTCDHRAVDGATAAEFLRTLKTLLEEPALAL